MTLSDQNSKSLDNVEIFFFQLLESALDVIYLYYPCITSDFATIYLGRVRFPIISAYFFGHRTSPINEG